MHTIDAWFLSLLDDFEERLLSLDVVVDERTVWDDESALLNVLSEMLRH